MSETVSLETVSAEVMEARRFEPESQAPDYIDPEIDDSELFNLVSQNAHIVVKFGSSEMTLSEVMGQIPITKDNMPSVISLVLELLANAAAKTEEPAEEDEPEEKESEENEPAKTEEANQKSSAKTEVQKTQKDSNKVDAKSQAKKEVSRTKPLEPSVQVAAKAEVLAVTNDTFGSSVPESVIDKKGKELTAEAPLVKNQLNETKPAFKSEADANQPIPTFEMPEAEVAADPIAKAKPAPYRPQLAAEPEIEPLILPAAIEAAVAPEPAETSTLDLKSPAISDDISELSNEKIETAEDKLEPAAFDYQTDINSPTIFAEEEFLSSHLEEADLEPDELYIFPNVPTLEVVEYGLEAEEEVPTSELGNESNNLGPIEITSPEHLVQVSPIIEEIEDSLIQLTERIETSHPETIEKLNKILDEIIEVPAKLEADSGENIIAETQAQEELEALFTELLDEMGIDYTPELIESLAYLTLKWSSADEIEKLKAEEAADITPQEPGTHEVIKELLVGLGIIKKTMTHACAIGKSALQLYSFNYD